MRASVLPSGDSVVRTPDDLILDPDVNFRTGVQRFELIFQDVTSLERDLLVLASAIHFYDVAHKRGMREEITRKMEMWLPVVNHQALKANHSLLERILTVLSDDNWTLHFERIAGPPEPMVQHPESKGETLLFSGGLDSLAYAVDALDARGTESLQLASHYTGNATTIQAQKKLHEYLQQTYGGKIDRVALRTGKKAGGEEAKRETAEVTQRTRSFLFLTIAALAARRRGMGRVVFIAENGQMAIHLPLSAARIGAFSTHTAHPEFVALASEFFTNVLDHEIQIDNPYLYKTKAEVVGTLAKNHADIIAVSNSCWRSSWDFGKHCGTCIPCYIRRIALEHHGVSVDPWATDLFREDVGALPFNDEGKRNLGDLTMFAE